MMRRTALVLVVIVGFASACSSGSESASKSPGDAKGIGLPAQKVPKDGAYPSALLRGTLERQGSCVYLRGSDGSLSLLVWSPGTKLVTDGTSSYVRDKSGSSLGAIGSTVSLGGGEVAGNAAMVGNLETACNQRRLAVVAPTRK